MAELARQRKDAYLHFFFVNAVLYIIYVGTHSIEISYTNGIHLFLGNGISVVLWIVAIGKAWGTASKIIKIKRKENQLKKLFDEKETAEKAMEELDILTPPEE